MKSKSMISISKLEQISKLENLNHIEQCEILPQILYRQGVLEYSIKKVYHKMSFDGLINIPISFDSEEALDKRKLSKWQLNSTVARVFKSEICDIKYLSDRIEITKLEKDISKTISIGVIFSGTEQDISLLVESLKNLKAGSDKGLLEIVICGPIDKKSKIEKILEFNGIIYLPYESEIDEYDRFMICKKKNFLYENMNGEIKVVSHSRIKYPSNFCSTLLSENFELACPIVKTKEMFDYLDLIFIEDYDILKPVKRRPVSSIIYGYNKYSFFKTMKPYVDGGIMIFNAKYFSSRPFNDSLAWGEAEDVELCSRAVSSGIHIDRIESLQCISLTEKIKRQKSLYSLFKLAVKRFTAKIGLY
ncbi:TPA: hypothetical protein ACGUXT_001217 [Vibrio vulnificus]